MPAHAYRPTPETKKFLAATILGKHKKFDAIAFEGPAGCGKTACAEYIHEQRKLPAEDFLPLVMNGQTTVEDLLLERTAENGSVVVRERAFLQMIQRPSTVYLDEYKTAPAEIMLALNSLLDHRKYWVGPNGVKYTRHPDNVIILSSNPEGYAGVKRQHGGFTDRLPTMQFDYSPDEGDILKEAYPDVDDESVARCLKLAGLIRESSRVKNTETIASTRGLLMMMGMHANGASLTDAFKFSIKIAPDEERAMNTMAELALGAKVTKNEKTGKTEIDLISGYQEKMKQKEKEVSDLAARLKTETDKNDKFLDTLKKVVIASKAAKEKETK